MENTKPIPLQTAAVNRWSSRIRMALKMGWSAERLDKELAKTAVGSKYLEAADATDTNTDT